MSITAQGNSHHPFVPYIPQNDHLLATLLDQLAWQWFHFPNFFPTILGSVHLSTLWTGFLSDRLRDLSGLPVPLGNSDRVVGLWDCQPAGIP